MVPSPTVPDNDVLAKYNTLLALNDKEYIDTDIWVDNEQLYSICEKQLGIASPTLSDMNRLIVQQASSLTTPRRFGGSR